MKRVGLIGLFLILSGCVKDVNFDQIDEVEIESVYIASLAYFDLLAGDFLDENFNEISQLEDFVMPQLNPDFAENVSELQFLFEFSNSFSRDFLASVYFFDADGNVIFQLDPTIQIKRNTEGVQSRISVVPPNIATIYSATTVGFYMQLLNDENQTLTSNSEGVLNLKSSLTLLLNVKR